MYDDHTMLPYGQMVEVAFIYEIAIYVYIYAMSHLRSGKCELGEHGWTSVGLVEC
jgi:hypothetical protein